MGADRPEPNCGCTDTPPTNGVVQRQLDHVAQLAVVDALGGGHDEGREDLLLREPGDGPFLEPPQVATAVVAGGLGAHAVELQVDLDAFPVPGEFRQQCVVARHQHPVGVDQDARDRSRHQLGEEVVEARVQGRLATAEHEDVDPAVLPLQALVHAGQDVGHGHHSGQVGRGVGEARRAAQVAHIGDVLQQDAGVLGLHLGEPLEVRARDRGEVAGRVRYVLLGGRGPLLQVLQDLRALVVERAHQAVRGAAPFQPHPAAAFGQPAGQPGDLGQGAVRLGVVALRAERVHIAQDPIPAQAHASGHWLPPFAQLLVEVRRAARGSGRGLS
ncbi:hypothetical protein F4561_005467 [Lipingzhangella halophila]|uniref:Uncharacterized protein n=1 Tax=Lipingzhangella halophila TaxID=1783352 RepID=A0A7W7W4Y0_9ACTN|nr:hypothetical protein [Lipingzhangella halophila]